MKRILFVSLAIIGLMFMSGPGPVQADLSVGLVAYYPFNGDANDESGNENDGIVSGATLTTDRFENKDSAYNFDGSSDGIDIPDTFGADGSNDMTVILWFNSDNITPSENKHLVSLVGESQTVIHSETDGTVKGFVQFDGPTNVTLSTDTLSANIWYHVALTYSTVDGTKLYLNGELVDSDTTIGLWTSGTQSNFIGTRADFKRDFDGIIDEVRIYSRVLSASEIKQLYWGGGEMATSTTGCSQTQLDAQYQAGIDYCKNNPSACGLSDGSTSTTCPSPDSISLNINDLSFTAPMTYGSMDLEASFSFFGMQGLDLLWKLDGYTPK